MRALVEALHSLLIALAAGGSVAVLIVVLICLIAFVAGSAYGIFFAAEAPGEDAFTVQQAVEQLGGEYRDYLQQIESTMPHDRQEIKANDDVYYIRWQDVLAVFSLMCRVRRTARRWPIWTSRACSNFAKPCGI